MGKAAACGLPGNNSRHLRDLALLLSLVSDPFDLSEQVTKSDRRYLRLSAALEELDHEAWRSLGGGHARDGQAARAVLLGA